MHAGSLWEKGKKQRILPLPPQPRGCIEFREQNHHMKDPNNNVKRLNEGHRTEPV